MLMISDNVHMLISAWTLIHIFYLYVVDNIWFLCWLSPASSPCQGLLVLEVVVLFCRWCRLCRCSHGDFPRQFEEVS